MIIYFKIDNFGKINNLNLDFRYQKFLNKKKYKRSSYFNEEFFLGDVFDPQKRIIPFFIFNSEGREVFSALRVFKNLILNFNNYNFSPDQEKETCFEICFYEKEDDTLYTYSIKFKNGLILDETLKIKKDIKKEKTIYSINKNLFIDNEMKELFINYNKNQSFLSYLISKNCNCQYTNKIFNLFNKIYFISDFKNIVFKNELEKDLISYCFKNNINDFYMLPLIGEKDIKIIFENSLNLESLETLNSFTEKTLKSIYFSIIAFFLVLYRMGVLFFDCSQCDIENILISILNSSINKENLQFFCIKDELKSSTFSYTKNYNFKNFYYENEKGLILKENKI